MKNLFPLKEYYKMLPEKKLAQIYAIKQIEFSF